MQLLCYAVSLLGLKYDFCLLFNWHIFLVTQLDEDTPPVTSERFEENKRSNEKFFHILFS